MTRAELKTALDMIYAGTEGEEGLHALGEVDLPDICVLVQGENGVGFLSTAGAADPRHLGVLLMLALKSLLDSVEYQALIACHKTPIGTEKSHEG